MKYIRFRFVTWVLIFTIGIIGLLIPFSLVYGYQDLSQYNWKPTQTNLNNFLAQNEGKNIYYVSEHVSAGDLLYVLASDKPLEFNYYTDGSNKFYNISTTDTDTNTTRVYSSITNTFISELGATVFSGVNNYIDIKINGVPLVLDGSPIIIPDVFTTPTEFLFSWDKHQETSSSKYKIEIIEPYPNSPTINHYTELFVKVEKQGLIFAGVPDYPSHVIVNGKYINAGGMTVQRIESSYVGGWATYKVFVPITEMGVNDIRVLWKYNLSGTVGSPVEQGVQATVTRAIVSEGVQPGEIDEYTGETYYPIGDPNNEYYEVDQNFNPNYGININDATLLESLSNVTNFLKNIGSFVGDIGLIMTDFFAFLPSPIPELIVSGLALFVTLAIFKIIRG